MHLKAIEYMCYQRECTWKLINTGVDTSVPGMFIIWIEQVSFQQGEIYMWIEGRYDGRNQEEV